METGGDVCPTSDVSLAFRFIFGRGTPWGIRQEREQVHSMKMEISSSGSAEDSEMLALLAALRAHEFNL